MLELNNMMDTIFNGITATMQKCGFEPVRATGVSSKTSAVYARDKSLVVDFSGEKGMLRLVYNDNRIHLLSGAPDADLSDDSAFNLDSTYLMIPDEYEERDVKSLVNEINEYIEDTYAKKTKIVSKSSKGPQTVSKAAAKSGALSYDSITLATKLGGMYPEIKDEIKNNIDTYGEFLCEDFFVNHANAFILQTINENNPQKLKKLFNILGEIYEDGTNEVQSLIAVTILGPIKDDPVVIQRIMPYLTDTMLEPVLSVSKRLSKSKSANLRLQNPPKYKPKKKKKSSGLLQQIMGGGQPGINN